MRVDKRRLSAVRRQGALLSTELLFLLPIFVIVVVAFVEFSALITAETQLLAASREGARTAALGGTQADAQAAVANAFGGSGVTVDIVYVNGAADPGNPVQVTVTAPAVSYVPNYLRYFGFDLTDRTMTARSVMTME